MSYIHRFIDGGPCDLPLGKVVCVGRNYAAHAKELNNPVPSTPMLFIKPTTAVVAIDDAVVIPKGKGTCHHELEVSVLIGEKLTNATLESVREGIVGYGLGLDLTLRDVQDRLKEKGHPWEVAKAFDGSCPLTEFVPTGQVTDPLTLDLQLERNGVLQQKGNTSDMITGVFDLVAFMSTQFTLLPGDVVMTGTPAGVGPLESGDELTLTLEPHLKRYISVV
ncbi:isomerase/hydrolase [Gammaproteobacteria bacterium 42_54_T18]|nr:isomerase/hydrolase [Gammaproteobacteria bacterium 42_54_T18]